MKKLFALLPLVVALTLLNSCSGTAQQTTTSPVSTQQSAPAIGLTNLDPAGFQKARKENPAAVVLDVRTPAEFAQTHIDGAVNIDLRDPNFANQIQKLDKSQTYLVYCRTGKRSAMACQLMQNEGFSSLYNLEGGIVAWQAAGN